VEYARASAPWTRPEAEIEDTTAVIEKENHTVPGAFRIAGRNSLENEKDAKIDLIKVAQQVTMEEGLQEQENAAAAAARSSIVSVGSAAEGDEGNWDAATGTMEMLVQLKRRSQRHLKIAPDSLMEDEQQDDQQQQQEQEEEQVISTECHWSNDDEQEDKKQEEHHPQRPSYAASTAPWVRPTGERQISAELGENHTTPGAFRVSIHQGDNDEKKLCDRLSFLEDTEMADAADNNNNNNNNDDVDDIVIATTTEKSSEEEEQDNEDAVVESKEMLEQLKRRKERKHQDT